MTYIPSQRSYEQVPTPQLKEALELQQEQRRRILNQLEAADVSIAAILNVLKERPTI